MKQAIVEKIRIASQEPGCYIFYGRRSEKSEFHPNALNIPLYVGKAANLRNRLKSYLKATDIKTESLHKEATRLDYIILRSDIEALIEESRLIKELKPKYNVLWRDDKSYLYVAFTREKFPKVFIVHKSLNPKPYTLHPSLIGPFTDGNALRLVMKLLRRHFPYCTCKQTHLRDCLNAQIGRCWGFCCKKTDPKLQTSPNLQKNKSVAGRGFVDSDAFVGSDRYKRNIRMIKAVLRGQSKKILKTLKDEKEKEALERIFEHKPYLADPKLQTYSNLQKQYKQKFVDSDAFVDLDRISRVECYDISDFAGKEAVGAMTVLKRRVPGFKNQEAWMADKSQWRKFKIKFAPTRDDSRMIAEVLFRRLNHPEWPYPDLIIIDGGITQYRAAAKALASFKNKESRIMNNCDKNSKPIIHNSLFSIQLISFAKPQQKIIGIENPSPELQKLVEQAIYQTHNFVIRYHRQVRSREFLKQ